MLARIANMKVDPEELMKKANQSGLVRYLFGDDLKGKDDTSISPLQRLSSRKLDQTRLCQTAGRPHQVKKITLHNSSSFL